METIFIQSQESKPRLERYAIYFSHRISEKRNVSRVMDFDNSNKLAYVSFKSTETSFGFVKLNPQNMNDTESISIHTNLVKDIKYSDTGLVMTASLDKSLKLTSTPSNIVTDTISLPLPGWSCCFDPSDEYKIMCGLANSELLIYDRRNTKSFLQKLQFPAIAATPLHSLFVKTVNNEPTIYCSNLKQTFTWDAHSRCNLWELEGCKGE